MDKDKQINELQKRIKELKSDCIHEFMQLCDLKDLLRKYFKLKKKMKNKEQEIKELL
tara:strand:- start:554 stop:724 length:171 start_codon:yes stop_codon:yes gene_type:complete